MASINKTFVRKIVKHYLEYDKDNPFIFICTLLAFLGISIGVMVLILTMGIMNGSENEFKKKLFIMNYPITINSIEYGAVNESLLKKLKKKFSKLKFSPYNITQVIAKNSYKINGAVLYAVDFNKESNINIIFKEALNYQKRINPTSKKFNIIAGKSLIRDMNMKIGDKLNIYFSQQEAVGIITIPKHKRFTIISQFTSGLSAYDKSIIYTDFKSFSRILNREKNIYDGIHIYSNNARVDIVEIKKFINNIYSNHEIFIEGWWEQNIGFFAAMEVEKKALFLLLMLIILVASLNIISSMLMTIMNRKTELALMISLGATRVEIKSIFLRLGALIGITGIIFGTALGFLGTWIINKFSLISLNEEVYGFSKLTVSLKPTDLLFIILGTIIIVLLSSYFPSIKASKINPIDVLKSN